MNTEYCSIHPSSDDLPCPYASLWDQSDVRAHRAMTEKVHEHGALAGAELWYGGSSASNLYTRDVSIDVNSRPSWQGEPVHLGSNRNGQILFFGAPGANVPQDFSFRATGKFTPTESGAHTFTLIQAGLARVEIDGDIVLDGVANPPGPGSASTLGSQAASSFFTGS